MSLPIFTIAVQGYSLYRGYQKTGVVGWEDVVQALAKIVPKMIAKANKIDRDALDDMVSDAKSRVPVDTGLLLNGIMGEATDDGCEFRASAVRALSRGESEDYAHFVEFGHHAGGATAADVFAGNAADFPRRARRKSSAPADIAAEPFFYSSANEALAARGEKMSDVIDQTANEDGWR